MTGVRVFILTTDGPVEVQRITAEDPGVQSVICLDGKAVSLPVSPAYEAFVRSPTGVVETCYGHPAYRLDVSGRISDGLSWQLGVLLAHGLHASERLAYGEGDIAVLATGEVDRDLNVLPVEDVPEKLACADSLIASLAAEGVAVTTLVPRANVPNPAGATPVDTVAEAFDVVGLRPPAPGLPVQANATPARQRRWMAPVLLSIFLLVAVSVVALWPRVLDREITKTEKAGSSVPVLAPTQAKVSPGPVVADLEITAVETRALPGDTCAAVHFEKAKPRIVEAAVRNTGRFVDSALQGLCGLAYRIANKGPPVRLTVIAARGAKGAQNLQSRIFFRNQGLERDEELSIRLIPPRIDQPLRLQFLLLSETSPDRQAGEALPPGFSDTPGKIAAVVWREFVARTMERKSTAVVSHVLLP